MDNVCPKMNGSKCAMEYCDFWNLDEQKCSVALESHKRVELMNTLLKHVDELRFVAEDKGRLEELIKKLNIVNPVSIMQ